MAIAKPVSNEGLKAMAKIMAEADDKDVFDLAEETLYQLMKDRRLARITKSLEGFANA